jgi:transcriptional regulator with XRE-family HTH domain
MSVTKASEVVRSWLDQHTQQELADLIGERIGRKVRQSTISAIKRGEATPRGDIMSALHEELQISIGWWSEPVAPSSEVTCIAEGDAANAAAKLTGTGTEG